MRVPSRKNGTARLESMSLRTPPGLPQSQARKAHRLGWQQLDPGNVSYGNPASQQEENRLRLVFSFLGVIKNFDWTDEKVQISLVAERSPENFQGRLPLSRLWIQAAKRQAMKLAGLLMLAAGWPIVIAALVLLRSPAATAGFVLAGLAVQVVGLLLTIRFHRLMELERG